MWSFSSVGWWRRLKLGSGDTILEPAKHEISFGHDRLFPSLDLLASGHTRVNFEIFGRRSGRLSASVGGYR
ncbi:hypothetical protein CASFOL_022583 [Castilleja foliolosa]|uniref:Uncharacterized protein n=1 Tax=Castilleja foliolosa TaxID=1961234 RepID=A0ABD3CYB4_9LAMI